MNRTLKLIALAIGLMLSGALCATAQSGDCYGSASGCIDMSFGGGWVVSNFWLPYYSGISAVATQTWTEAAGTRQRIVAVVDSAGWNLMGYNTDGTLDPCFGDPTGCAGNGIVRTPSTLNLEWPEDVALQSDNGIIVVGNAHPSNSFKFLVARYSRDGVRDMSFGQGRTACKLSPRHARHSIRAWERH